MADPLTTFDVRRFNAIRSAQAQIGREIKSCLQELRRLRDDPLAESTGEPDEAWENECMVRPVSARLGWSGQVASA